MRSASTGGIAKWNARYVEGVKEREQERCDCRNERLLLRTMLHAMAKDVIREQEKK